MPLRVSPEPTFQELLEKIETLENLIVFGGVKESLTKRAEKTLFTPSTTTTTLVTLLLQSEGEKTSSVEFLDGKGNHLDNLVSSKPHGEFQTTFTFILAAGESWEWKKAVGSEGENVFSTYWSIGGIGSKGTQGIPGEKGEKGEKGEPGSGLTFPEIVKKIEEQLFKLLTSEKLEKLKQLVGEALEISKVKSIEGEGFTSASVLTLFKELKAKSITVENPGFLFIRGLLRGESVEFTEGEGGALALWKVGNKAGHGKESFVFVRVIFTSSAEPIKRMEASGETGFPEGSIVFMTNASGAGINLVFENEEALHKTGSFTFVGKANLIVEPGHTIGLFLNKKAFWQDLLLR